MIDAARGVPVHSVLFVSLRDLELMTVVWLLGAVTAVPFKNI